MGRHSCDHKDVPFKPGRNPHMSQEEIEKLKEYLNVEKVIWITDGIDPLETDGHVDDAPALFVGRSRSIWTDDPEHPFYEVAQQSYRELCEATDAKGRKLKVHKLCLTKEAFRQGASTIDRIEGTILEEDGEIVAASYMNFLIVNGGVIVPLIRR